MTRNRARDLARRAKVPVVPGSDGLVSEEADAIKIAKEIGYPVLIKASAGGGGKGMRVAANELSLQAALQQARNEAEAAFGNADCFIEKYIERPRHVEVQVLADKHGNVVHLWERDCSTQRRHQKLIEESPAPHLPAETRQAMCDAAVRLVKTAKYANAGTVEFIVDQENNFYFIEVNARIQVEHPVTELVTGIDLIQAQIRVASGEKLWFGQEDIPQVGVAMECRINAENPARNISAKRWAYQFDADSGWSGSTIRLPCARWLHCPALLRFDDRQTYRPSAYKGRSDSHDEPRPCRAASGRYFDNGSVPPAIAYRLDVRRRPHGYDLCRAKSA